MPVWQHLHGGALQSHFKPFKLRGLCCVHCSTTVQAKTCMTVHT